MTTTTSYIVGFLISIALTMIAFGGVLLHEHTGHIFPTHSELAIAFIILAVAQLLVQLFFFLHVGRGQNKHWNAAVLGFALFVIAVVVGGTLWIMHNLSEKSMQSSPYIQNNITVQNEND